MENKADNIRYIGPDKFSAGFKGFVASAALWYTIPATMVAALYAVLKKAPFGATLEHNTSLKTGWGKGIAAISLVFGALSGLAAFKRASVAEEQHNKLVADNNAMRAQLNQTGQALMQAAQQIERGESHAAKLGRPITTHREQAQAAKLAAAEATNTIH